jgi:magnesium chelatase family protein
MQDLSARAHHRVLRIARTIADLEGRGAPELADFEEALAFRLAPFSMTPIGVAA